MRTTWPLQCWDDWSEDLFSMALSWGFYQSRFCIWSFAIYSFFTICRNTLKKLCAKSTNTRGVPRVSCMSITKHVCFGLSYGPRISVIRQFSFTWPGLAVGDGGSLNMAMLNFKNFLLM